MVWNNITYLRRRLDSNKGVSSNASTMTTRHNSSDRSDNNNNNSNNNQHSNTTDNKKYRKKIWCKKTTVLAAVSIFCATFLAFMQGSVILKYLMVEHDATGSTSSTSARSSTTTTSSGDENNQVARREAAKVTETNSNNMCTAIMSKLTSTAAAAATPDSSISTLWIEHILTILEASKHSDDPLYSHKDWTKSLLVALTPSILQQQQQRQDDEQATATSIERILDIVVKRINNPFSNRPLKIAVLGGSTTEGNGCEIASVKLPKDSLMGNPIYCAWPYRLESFINNMLSLLLSTTTTPLDADTAIVKVVNMAEEGTSTTVKTPSLKYWMYPADLIPEGPDIIIHAYTARDALPFEHENESLIDALRRELSTLVESVKVSRPCGHPPLVIHVSDTPIQSLKNSNDSNIFLALDYSKAITKVATMVEQLQQKQQKHLDEQEIPFGMAGHLAMVWLLTYNIADALLSHCHHHAMNAINNDDAITNKCQESPCIMAMLAGPTGTALRAHQITSQLAPYVTENTGWRSETDMTTGWSRKAGLVAVEKNATLVLEHAALPVAIRMINIMSVKSYSTRFLNSVARFKVSVLTAPSSSSSATTTTNTTSAEEEQRTIKWSSTFEIQGTHTSMTHITFPFALDMKDNAAQIGETLRVEATLVKGSTFKILGMMFCSR